MQRKPIIRIMTLLLVIEVHGFRSPGCRREGRMSSQQWQPCVRATRCLCWTETLNDTERTYVSCRNVSLTEVPVNLPNSSVSIDLSENKIESLGEQTFKGYPNLVDLTLTNNKLSQIGPRAFEGLQKLERLSLLNNSVRYNVTGFQTGTFKPLENLLSLNIQQSISEKEFKDENYELTALSDLLNLEYLYLDGIPGEILGMVFQQLTSLKGLTFGQWGRCYLKTLPQDFFPENTTITNVSILNCKLEMVEAGVFKPLSRLRYLDLSYNEKLTFDSLNNITYEVSPNIETLKINQIYKPVGPCVVLQKKHLKALENLTLKEIHLDSNRITTVEVKGVMYIPLSLETISVRDNNLMVDSYIFCFVCRMMRSNLTRFIMSDQFTSHYPSDILSYWKFIDRNGAIDGDKHRRNTKELNLRTDIKTKLKDWFGEQGKEEHRLKRIDINCTYDDEYEIIKSNNQRPDSTCVPFQFPLPSNLNYFDASNIKMRYLVVRHVCLETPNNLRVLNLSQNLLWELQGPFPGFENLTELDMSWNFCSRMSPNAFQGLTNFHFLNLSRNYLDTSLYNDTFQDQHNLKILDLSWNRLTKLPKNIFKGLVSLKELYLTQNLLIDFTVELAHIKSLGLIKLDWNQLETISESTRNIFDQLAQKHSLVLDLANNKFKCNCDNMPFLKWMTKSSVTFENIHEYMCYFGDGQTGNLSDVDFIYNKLEKKCTNYTALIITLTAAVVLSLTLISAGIVYRYRWNLRYIYYMAKYKANHKRHGYDAVATADEYVWDVNVSYADEDYGFVVQKIYTELEVNRGVKLFIRDRNAPVDGRFICDNIFDAIEGTKKTLVILSNAYLKHKWCVFEMNMVGIKALKTDSNLACVLLLEDVPHHDLPLKILKIIKDQECVEYPGPANLQDCFWDRLQDLCVN